MTVVSREAARAELWRRGQLRYLLDDCKRPVYDDIRKSTEPFVFEAGRKVGKSVLGLTLAFEQSIRLPGARVNYAAATSKAVKEIILPIARELLADCPKALRPTWKKAEEVFEWPNGSRIVVAGAEDETKCERLRGPQSHMSIVDEAGFVPVLRYLVTSILSPQHLRTHGLLLMLSSPPKSPDHDFAHFADACMANGRYAHRSIYSPGLAGMPDPEAYVASQARLLGLTVEQFKGTDEYRRELLALRVIDSASAAIPEWGQAEAVSVREFELPKHYHGLTAVDLGYIRNYTGGLVCVPDFEEQRLLVCEEVLLARPTTKLIVEATLAAEASTKPHKRFRYVDDPGGGHVRDLSADHGFQCSKAPNSDWDANRALTRNKVQAGKVVVHPRCTKLIHQLRTALVDKHGRLRETADGQHADLVAALVIAVRQWESLRHLNPTPTEPTVQQVMSGRYAQSPLARALR